MQQEMSGTEENNEESLKIDEDITRRDHMMSVETMITTEGRWW
jgi:hypothetical protein